MKCILLRLVSNIMKYDDNIFKYYQAPVNELLQRILHFLVRNFH